MSSLVAGFISRIALLLCFYEILKGNLIAANMALIVALALGGRFLLTITKNFKIMPDFFMMLFRLLNIILVLQLLF